MRQSGARHGAVFAQTLAQDLLAQGYTTQQIFEGSSFGPGLLTEEKPISEFAPIAALFEHAARLTGNDLLGFEYGIVREMGRLGLICYVGLSSPTVSSFLKNIARYRRVFSDVVELDLGKLDQSGVIQWYFTVPSKVSRRQHVEFGASGLLAPLRQSTGRDIKLKQVTFRHARNTNVDKMEEFFGCKVLFGQPTNSFTFRHEDLALPLKTADNNLYSVLKEHAEDILKRKTRNVPDLISEVERMIVDHLVTGAVSQRNVSRAMGMSPRTLARRLAEENTTFFKTLEDLRKSLAESYLKDSNLSLGEVAFLLGYSSLSSFNEAFKRWAGKTPGQYRSS